MTETNFCDGLESCIVNGHTPMVVKDLCKIDIINNQWGMQQCTVCGMVRDMYLRPKHMMEIDDPGVTFGEWKSMRV